MTRKSKILGTTLAVSIILLGFGWGYTAYVMRIAFRDMAISFKQLSKVHSELNAELIETKARLSDTESRNASLAQKLDDERAKNFAFESQIRDLAGTVGRLDKLSRTDPELLKKYSKVFFLSENYIPESLTVFGEQYLANPDSTVRIHSRVVPFLTAMLDQAYAENIPLLIVSGYRSFDTQSNLKSNYKITYGAGTANSFSADQGYSEHQLGTTVDFSSQEIDGRLLGFSQTDAYEWLRQNAHQYGFTLSYPKDNEFYIFEPWHWRFVGTELATLLHTEGRQFYELDQREIDSYLINVFD